MNVPLDTSLYCKTLDISYDIFVRACEFCKWMCCQSIWYIYIHIYTYTLIYVYIYISTHIHAYVKVYEYAKQLKSVPYVFVMLLIISFFNRVDLQHDDVIKWKHFPRYWPFARGIHRSPVNSPHKGQWRGALMFSVICVWINVWVNNREAGDFRRYRPHFDVIIMIWCGDWIQGNSTRKCWRKLLPMPFFTLIYFFYRLSLLTPLCINWVLIISSQCSPIYNMCI